MPDESEQRWPRWDEPATRGDLIRVMTAVRRCVVEIAVVLSATRRGDQEKAGQFIDQLFESDDRLSQLIDNLGGKKVDD